MTFRVLRDTSARSGAEALVYTAGTVVSDEELDPLLREKLVAGDPHCRALFEPLSEEEAHEHRARLTAVEGARPVDGQWISPPWADYVGLHQVEILKRLRESPQEKTEQVKRYERGGLKRHAIVNFEPSAEALPDGHGRTPAQALRWAEANPGNAEHIAQLERRIVDLEGIVSKDHAGAPSTER